MSRMQDLRGEVQKLRDKNQVQRTQTEKIWRYIVKEFASFSGAKVTERSVATKSTSDPEAAHTEGVLHVVCRDADGVFLEFDTKLSVSRPAIQPDDYCYVVSGFGITAKINANHPAEYHITSYHAFYLEALKAIPERFWMYQESAGRAVSIMQ